MKKLIIFGFTFLFLIPLSSVNANEIEYAQYYHYSTLNCSIFKKSSSSTNTAAISAAVSGQSGSQSISYMISEMSSQIQSGYNTSSNSMTYEECQRYNRDVETYNKAVDAYYEAVEIEQTCISSLEILDELYDISDDYVSLVVNGSQDKEIWDNYKILNREYEENLNIVMKIDGCLEGYKYQEQYNYNLGIYSEYSGKPTIAIQYYKSTLTYTKNIVEGDLASDAYYTDIVDRINSLANENNVAGLCSLNAYYTYEGDCECRQGYFGKNRVGGSLTCELIEEKQESTTKTIVSSQEKENTIEGENNNHPELQAKIDKVIYVFYTKYKNKGETTRNKVWNKYITLLSSLDLSEFDEEKQFLISQLIEGFKKLRDDYELYEFDAMLMDLK